jgi:hypothetical protein
MFARAQKRKSKQKEGDVWEEGQEVGSGRSVSQSVSVSPIIEFIARLVAASAEGCATAGSSW